MLAVSDLRVLVDKCAAVIPQLGLDADEQEKYCMMVLRLQNQVETGEPSEAIVNECLAFFQRVESRAA